MSLPVWWNWELEFTPHLERRMKQRSFTEVDLRSMLQASSGYHQDVVEGRYVIGSILEGRTWEIIVEADFEDQVLLVITAYRL